MGAEHTKDINANQEHTERDLGFVRCLYCNATLTEVINVSPRSGGHNGRDEKQT